MATIFERTSSGIIYKPTKDRDYPRIDLLSLLFDSDLCGAQEDTVLHADAADPTKSVTKAQLRTLVERTAHTLRHQYGIGQHGPSQDVVLAICTGHWLLPNLFYSTIAADGIFSASNPGSTPKELATQLTQVSVKLLFCTEDTKPTAIAAAKLANLPLSRVLVLPPASTAPGTSFQLISQSTLQPIPLSIARLPWRRLTTPSSLTTTTICLLFSSGTTGPPKACRLSHTNMVSEATLVIDENRAHYTRHGLPQPAYRTVAHLPAAHIAGIQGYFVNPFYTGGAVYWMPRFDLPLFLEYSKRYRMTSFFSVPPVFLAIAKSPLVTDQFDDVETAVSGAAPMGRELQAAAQKKLGKGSAQLTQTWGLSETTGSMTLLPVGTAPDWTGSVSQLLGSTRMRIVDDEDRDVEPGSEGEIWVKGPQVTEGYYGNDKANAEAFVDGWFRTGDVGLVKGGLLYIVDRKKELIKYKGNQVAPAELEALLVSHSKILDAAVIGVDLNDTEVPRAYIVADPKQVTADEIIEWVAGQVSNHKRLRGGVVFLPAIPKSPSGKILRKDLRALAKKQAGESKL